MPYEIEIPSTGEFTIVSDEDYPIIKRFTWYKNNGGYAATRISGVHVLLHRFIMDVKGNNVLVDHINGNKLDNRRENLRIVNHSENNQSRSPLKKFPFIGIDYSKERQKFYATFKKDKARKRIGPFDTALEAALCYDKAVLKAFGEHALTNEKFLQSLLAKFKASK